MLLCLIISLKRTEILIYTSKLYFKNKLSIYLKHKHFNYIHLFQQFCFSYHMQVLLLQKNIRSNSIFPKVDIKQDFIKNKLKASIL